MPYSLAGVPRQSPIVVGSHGCLKNREDRARFVHDLKMSVDVLKPSAILVYGTDSYGVLTTPSSLAYPSRSLRVRCIRGLVMPMSAKTESGLARSAPSKGRGFAENVEVLKSAFDYPDGLDWSLRKGKRLASIEADDSVAVATMFAGMASQGFVSEIVNDRGYRRKLVDGTIVGLRIVTSSEGSPAVDFNIAGENHVHIIHS